MKRPLLIFSIFIFLFNINLVDAQVNTFDRNEYPNLGVNKDTKISASKRGNVLNTALVDSSEKVYDFANILTDQEEEKLRQEIYPIIDAIKMDIVILTINQTYSYDEYNENIAVDFYDYNDFGIDFYKYSGILLLRNANPRNPYYDIYTFGEAQLYFNNDRINYILDRIGDNIGDKKYYLAFSQFIDEVDFYYNIGIPSEYKDYYINSNGDLVKPFNPPIGFAFIFSALVTFVIIFNLVKRNKMVIKPTKADEYLDVNTINFTEKNDTFRNSVTTSYTSSSSSSGSSGGGSHRSGGGGSHSRGSSGRSHSSGGGRHR